MKALMLAALASLPACIVRLEGRPLPPGAPEPGPPPAATHDIQNVLRAKEVRAGTVRAKIVYAKEVRAGDGRIGRIFEGESEAWDRGRSDANIEAQEVSADVIYAKEVQADWIEAGEIHAKRVRIGRR